MQHQPHNRRSTNGYRKPRATWRNVLCVITCVGTLIFLWVIIFWLVFAAFGE